MEQQSYDGHWWAPNEDDNKVAGTLSYSPEEGIELELFGTISGGDAMGPSPYSVLYGLSSDGARIELNECFRSSFSFSGSSARESYRANLMSVNENGATPNTEFDTVYVSFPLLSKWAESTPRPSIEGGTSQDRPQKVTISVELPEDQLCYSNNPKIYIRVKGGPRVSDTEGGIDIFSEVRFDFETGSVDTTEWQKYIFRLGNLLTFATGEPIEPNYVRGRTDYDEDTSITSDIFFEPGLGKKTNSDKSPAKYLFSSSDYEGKSASVIEEWFEMYEELKMVLNTYCGITYKNQYASDKFLSIMSCLEGYYNRRFSESNQDQSSSIGVVDFMINEYYESIESARIANINMDSFSEKVSESRNCYIHQKKQKGENVIQKRELPNYSRMLQALLDAALLHELNIDSTAIERGIDRRYSMEPIEF